MPSVRPNRGTPGTRITRLLGLLALLAALVLWFRRPTPPPSPPPGSPSASPAAHGPDRAREAAVIQAFVNLESAEAEAERTLLGPEGLAQQFGSRIEALWDALNQAPDPFALLAGAPVAGFILPDPGPGQALPHGILLRRPVPAAAPGPAAQPVPWPGLRPAIDELRDAGWKLTQSEWRHVRFQPSPPSSQFEVRLHLVRPTPARRAQVLAKVRFDWPAGAETAPDGTPSAAGTGFGTVTVEDYELLEREGPPAFAARDEIELSPFPRTTWIDPVLVRDPGGDGKPEVLLAARNLALHPPAGPGLGWGRSEITPHHPGLMFTALLADFTGDGRPDLLCAVRAGLVLLRAGASGTFDTAPVPAWTAPERLHYAQALTCGDIDADGDLDLFLGQYRTPYEGGQMPRPFFDALDGPPAYLLTNDGSGRFQDATPGSGLEPRRHRRTYGASFADLDHDGDLDLWVTSDFAGADAWANDGRGRFREVTPALLDDAGAFGMSHSFSDFDADGLLDALLVGMPQPTASRLDALGIERPGFERWSRERGRLNFGNRLFFGTPEGFRQRPAGGDVARAGWAWSAAAFDLDHDRFPDLHVVNGHETRQSVRDYEREFWTHDIYVGDSTPRPEVEAYFSAKFTTSRARGWSYGGYDKNRLFLNLGGTGFVEVGHLFGVALEADSRNVVAEDLDADGDLDLLVTTFEIWPRPRQTVRIFENQLEPTGHWIGFRLPQPAGGPAPFGATVSTRDRRGSQVRVHVAGDGYRSQQRAVLRFGLGDVPAIDSAEVRWPGSARVRLGPLQAGRIHDVPPPSP